MQRAGAGRIRAVGPDAVLVEVPDTSTALALADDARRAALAVEVVPGAATVLLDGVADPATVRAWVQDWRPSGAVEPGPLLELAVTYDGPDLDVVADAWGIAPEDVAARHSGVGWVAAFGGFAPGFAYLVPLGTRLREVPRRRTPRPRVAPGSVALAGPWTGLYPSASPGGWQVIGHTDAVLWDVDRSSPSLVTPGTRVRFVAR